VLKHKSLGNQKIRKQRTQKFKTVLTFSLCLTALLSGDYSRLSRVPNENLWGLLRWIFFSLDAISVIQPTVSKTQSAEWLRQR